MLYQHRSRRNLYQCTILILAIICAFAGRSSLAQDQHLPPCPTQADDVDGDGYGWNNRSCLVTVESLAPPAILSPDTGAPASLERVFWTVEDLHNRSIVCQLYYLHPDAGQYLPYNWKAFYNHFLDGEPSSIWLGSVLEAIEEPGFETQVNLSDQWYLENGYYRGGSSPLSWSPYVEYSGDTFRIWRDQREYWSCKYASEDHQTRPSSFPPTSNIADLYYVQCEDTVPPGDGWGWDGFGSCVYREGENNQRYVSADYIGATQQLPPDTGASPGCDYGNAEHQGGWGWNSLTNSSCPPLVSTPPGPPDDTAAECTDTDGDGWGWNGSESCLVTETTDDQCDSSDADLYGGWGWNPVTMQSCAPVNQ